jgi:hypothetical protein
VWATPTDEDRVMRYGDQGGVVGDIEMEGWELIHAGWAFKEISQSSRDKLVLSGQRIATLGQYDGFYLFRATNDPPRTDQPWST